MYCRCIIQFCNLQKLQTLPLKPRPSASVLMCYCALALHTRCIISRFAIFASYKTSKLVLWKPFLHGMLKFSVKGNALEEAL